jgi:hypothetical protein
MRTAIPTLICAKEAAGIANRMAASNTVLMGWRIVFPFPKYAFKYCRFDKDLKLEHCKDKPRVEMKVGRGTGSLKVEEDVDKFVVSIYNTERSVCRR